MAKAATVASGRRNTRQMTIEAAERLLARHGADGVSMRQIAAEAGATNHFAVQYHFGDMAGLISAIFEYRLPSLELRRSKLLSAVAREGRMNDPRALVEVVYRPLADEKDRDGRRSYAAFLASLRYFEEPPTNRLLFSDLTPVTNHVLDLLAASIPHVPKAWFMRRLLNASVVVNSCVVDLDREQARGSLIVSEEAFLRDALDTATAALTAPVSPELLAELPPESPEGGET